MLLNWDYVTSAELRSSTPVLDVSCICVKQCEDQTIISTLF